MRHVGSTASTRKPPSSRGSVRSRPPRVRTRSPNPTRPKPPPAAATGRRAPGRSRCGRRAGRPAVRPPRRRRRRARACRRWSAPPARSGRRPGRRRGRRVRPRRGGRAGRRSCPPRGTARSGAAGRRGPAAGRAERPPSPARSTPTIWRSSSSACRPAVCTWQASCSTRSGSAAAISIAPACSTMRLTRWPTASCISRAMRVRSVRTASRASSSRSASARSARSRSAATSSARVRAQAPSAPDSPTTQGGAADGGEPLVELVQRPRLGDGQEADHRGPDPHRPAALVAADGVGGQRDGDASPRGRRRRAPRRPGTARAAPSGGTGTA